MNKIGAAGATYYAIEFHGKGVEALSVSERMTLANLASEMGAKTAIFPPDKVLIKWSKEKHGSSVILQEELFWSDKDAIFSREIILDLAKLEPLFRFHQNFSKQTFSF